jgi:hypothetical protein
MGRGRDGGYLYFSSRERESGKALREGVRKGKRKCNGRWWPRKPKTKSKEEERRMGPAVKSARTSLACSILQTPPSRFPK